MLNYDGMAQGWDGYSTIDSAAYFGKREAISARFKRPLVDLDLVRLREQGIYVVKQSSRLDFFVVLDDISFNMDHVSDVAVLLLRLMMSFCSGIHFLLLKRETAIVKKINALYPTHDLLTGKDSSEVELMKLSWLFLIRQAYNEYPKEKGTPLIGYQAAEINQYLKHLLGATTFNKMRTQDRPFKISKDKIIQKILSTIPVSWAILGDCISSYPKPCFVLCVIGRTPLNQTINLMTGNHVTSSGEVNLRLMCESDFQLVIINWSGCEKQSELKALAFAANVANYTIYSTKPSTLWPLLQQVPESDFLSPRTNSGPLCFFSKDVTETVKVEDNPLITSYFGGQIHTIKYESEEAKLKVIWKRIVLECQARAEYGYMNGKDAMNRIDASLGASKNH